MTGDLPRPIVIVGPTAGGKSELAVALAQRLSGPRAAAGQVLGADSMQVYRGLDAGTAKPSPSLRARAVHHLIDIVEPTERFTVADWLSLADPLIEGLTRQGVTPIVVGGTNFYLRALLEGLFEGPPLDDQLRARLQSKDNAALHVALGQVDPASAARIHPNDRKRLIRALEVFEQTGKPMSQWQTQWEDWGLEKGQGTRDKEAGGGTKAPRQQGTEGEQLETQYRHNPLLIGLHWPVEAINPRINLRVKAMFFPDKVDPALAAEITPRGESLIDETRRLQAAGQLGPQARMALGYQQVLDHLAGRCSLEEAFERTKILTRRFAKTQRTWLKRFVGVHWFDASSMTASQLLDAAVNAAHW